MFDCVALTLRLHLIQSRIDSSDKESIVTTACLVLVMTFENTLSLIESSVGKNNYGQQWHIDRAGLRINH